MGGGEKRGQKARENGWGRKTKRTGERREEYRCWSDR